jgi:antitoxin component YwqK of YwqJK toxin-antitoxin module
MLFFQGPGVTTKFSYRGFSVKNGILEGLGKLKLNSEQTNEICLKVNKVLGRDPVEIIGTFVNGTLNGNAKIVLHDGRIIIANYLNGLSDGFSREWNKNGTLEFAGFYQVLILLTTQ